MDETTIRERANAACKVFDVLIIIGPAPEESGKAKTINAEDQLARFKIWGGNIGVNAEGHASLDYRLRDSPQVKELMLELLEKLQNHLQRAIDIARLSGNSTESQEASLKPGESGIDPYEYSQSSAASSSFHGTETDSLAELLQLSPFDQHMHGIEQTIDRLYRLSIALRRPSIVSQNVKAANFVIRDEEGNAVDSEFEGYALKRVTHQFPKAPPNLLRRLATAITLRRRRFLYRHRHQKKLRSHSFEGLPEKPPSLPSPDKDGVSTIRGARTVQPSPQNESSTDNKYRKPLISQTTATSASFFPPSQARAMPSLETSTKASTAFQISHDPAQYVQVPDAPQVSPGSKEFECPYCWLMLPIEEAKGPKWRRHVINDLEPYVCLSEECADAHHLFRDRASWLHHMQKEHTMQWSCTAPGHNPCILSTRLEFEDHMRSQHSGKFTESQLPWLEKRSRRPASTIFTFCLLCEHMPSQGELEKESVLRGLDIERDYDRRRLLSECLAKHMATHLDLVSLISLPWQDNVEEGAVTEKSASAQAEQGTRKSDDEEPELSFDDNDDNLARLQASQVWWEEMNENGSTVYSEANPTFAEEWSFIELARYFGHDRDPKLQTFLRKLYLDFSPAAYNCNGPFLPAYLMPLGPSPNFFGRELVLKAIGSALCPWRAGDGQDTGLLAFPRTFAIYASGGMGKTQVAAQFVATHRHEFDAIFWVHADHISTLSQDFKAIAITLGLISEDSVDSNDLVFMREIVKRWLVTPLKDLTDDRRDDGEKATWLLVFDGVEDPDILNDFWPYDGPGSVLITSRSPFSWASSLPLRPFTSDEATGFLLKITGREASEEVRNLVTKVSQRLGGLPLALTQMAGIILHKQLSFEEFLNSYNERRSQQELLQLSTGGLLTKPAGYEHTLASVWAFESLSHGQGLLDVVSMLDPDGILESLLTSNPGTVDLAYFPQTLEDYKTARNELLACSLVTGNKLDQKLFIHRLIQDVARARMTQIEFRANFMACVKLITSIWPFEAFAWRHGVARWTSCEGLFPHVSRLKDLFPQVAPSDAFSEDDYRFAKLLTDAGWYHHERGGSSESVLFNNMAQDICESLKARLSERSQIMSPNAVTHQQLDSILAEIQHNRGCIATEINEPYDALTYHKSFNAMMVQEMGTRRPSNDMRLAISWNQLGNAYMLNGDWSKGEECFQKSVDLLRQLDNFEKVSISLPVVNLGLAFWLQGRFKQANAILMEGLDDRVEAFGPDDRVSFITGRFLHALGNIRASQGAMTESLTYHRKALLHYKSTLGSNHHRTADTFVKVAEHHIRLRQHETANALLGHALKAYSSSSSSNAYVPEKARASFKQSRALRFLGQTDEADTELQKCFEVYEKLSRKGMQRGGDGQSDGNDIAAAARSPPRQRKEDLVDQDFDDMIAFWSK